MNRNASSHTFSKIIIGTLLTAAVTSAAFAGEHSSNRAPNKASNKAPIVITAAADVKYRPLDPHDTEGKGPQISLLFGDFTKSAPVGFLFKVPGGFRPGPHIHSADYYSVVLEGAVHDFAAGDSDEGTTIGPGGHWFQAGKAAHDNHCASATPCVIFIYSPTGYDYIPVKTGPGRR